jgi:hypothetical protein
VRVEFHNHLPKLIEDCCEPGAVLPIWQAAPVRDHVQNREKSIMRFYWLLLGILGVWRITHLLQAEDGPWNLLVKLRRAAGHGVVGALMDCFYCLSVWIAAPFAWWIGEGWKERLFLWPAISGGAILLERFSGTTAAAEYVEDEESNHVLR